MAHSLYIVSVFLHLLAAIVWIGGMAFLVLFLAPALRKLGQPAVATAIFRTAGRSFRIAGWICLAVLFATGLENLASRGYHLDDLTSAWFWTSDFGRLLAIKLILVAAILVLSSIHDFYIGPAAVRGMEGGIATPEVVRLRALATWFGRINFLLSLAVALFGVMLVRGAL